VIPGPVLLPDELRVADPDRVAGPGPQRGLARELLLAEGVRPALVRLQGDGGQQQPGGDEPLVAPRRGGRRGGPAASAPAGAGALDPLADQLVTDAQQFPAVTAELHRHWLPPVEERRPPRPDRGTTRPSQVSESGADAPARLR